MEENKKSGGGDVRAKALSWDIEWEKAKNVFFGFFPLTPTVARCVLATHIPRLPKKKPLRGKKVGFAEKKLRLWLKMAHRVYQGWHIPTYGFLPRPTLRGSLLWLRLAPSCASASPRLHGVAHDRPSTRLYLAVRWWWKSVFF